jgi:hypothetical protein
MMSLAMTTASDDFGTTYPPRFERLPTPLPLPFPLKPFSSADTGVEHMPDGRTKYWIRHDVVRGVGTRRRFSNEHEWGWPFLYTHGNVRHLHDH